MSFCYSDNKILFITTGAGALISFITNLWFAFNLKCKKQKIIRKTKSIEMIGLNHVTNQAQNVCLNIKEQSSPEFNSESLPDWVKTEYKSHHNLNIIV